MIKFKDEVTQFCGRNVRFAKHDYVDGRIIFKDIESGNIVSMPKEITGDIGTHVYYTGQHGVNEYGVDELVITNCHDGVVILNEYKKPDLTPVPSEKNDNWGKAIAINDSIIDSIEKEYGIKFNYQNEYGVSMGDAPSMRAFAESDNNGVLCIMGASCATSYNPIGAEINPYVPNNPRRAFLTQNQYQQVAGRTVLLFESGDGEDYTYVNTLAENGANVYLFEVLGKGNSAHDNAYKDAIRHDLFAATSGNRGALNNLCQAYPPKKYENGKWVTANIDEVYRSVVNSNSTSYKTDLAQISSIDDLTKAGKFDVNEYTSEVSTKYSSLSTLSNLSLSYLNSGLQNSELASDLNYVSDYMSKIRTEIKSSNFLTSLKGMSFRSQTGMPGALIACINAYFDAVGSLLSSLSDETEAITSYAQAYADMDANFDENVNAITLNSSFNGIDAGVVASNGAGQIIAYAPVTIEQETENTSSEGSYGGGGYYGGGSTGGNGNNYVVTGRNEQSSPTIVQLNKGEDNDTTDISTESGNTIETSVNESNNNVQTVANVNNNVEISTINNNDNNNVTSESQIDDVVDTIDDNNIQDLDLNNNNNNEVEVKPDITPQSTTIIDNGTKTVKHNNIGKKVAGIVAAGAGVAGAAYGIHKIKEKSDNNNSLSEDEDFEFNDEDSLDNKEI